MTYAEKIALVATQLDSAEARMRACRDDAQMRLLMNLVQRLRRELRRLVNEM